jgi:hypothetical protein
MDKIFQDTPLPVLDDRMITFKVVTQDRPDCLFKGGVTEVRIEMTPSSVVGQFERQIQASLGEKSIPYHMLSLVTSNGLELHSSKQLADYFDVVCRKS